MSDADLEIPLCASQDLAEGGRSVYYLKKIAPCIHAADILDLLQEGVQGVAVHPHPGSFACIRGTLALLQGPSRFNRSSRSALT